MNEISYSEREKVYMNAFLRYGTEGQLTVAVEELSEAQKEICKVLRGKGRLDKLAEEVADATIMLEQVRMLCGINEEVCREMDRKILRLNDSLAGEAYDQESEENTQC